MRKKKMIRLLLACGLLMSPVIAQANNEPKMVVTTVEGSSYEFFIADNPTIQYKENLLVCQNDKGLSVSVEAANVKSFKFFPSESDTGINQVSFSSSFGSKLSGLTAGSKVLVVSLDGKVVKSLKANDSGTIDIDFTQLPHGIFVVKTENNMTTGILTTLIQNSTLTTILKSDDYEKELFTCNGSYADDNCQLFRSERIQYGDYAQ